MSIIVDWITWELGEVMSKFKLRKRCWSRELSDMVATEGVGQRRIRVQRFVLKVLGASVAKCQRIGIVCLSNLVSWCVSSEVILYGRES